MDGSILKYDTVKLTFTNSKMSIAKPCNMHKLCATRSMLG